VATAFLVDVVGQGGAVSPDVVSGRLRITKTELAHALGLSRDSVSKPAAWPRLPRRSGCATWSRSSTG
jgi:hypothetical protein